MLTITPNQESRFKFIFDDSKTSFITAKDYRQAAILAAANRIRAKKEFKIIGAWAQKDGGKNWDKLQIQTISLQLN